MNLRETLGAKERLRDPIYGFIQLTDYESKIVDLPVFQRLRRIHQLALTKYVYPSAEHSRFVHSIGVLEAASNIYEELHKNKKNNNALTDEEHINNFKTMRVAALLHDIGHLPFSHAAENVLLTNGSHEDLSEFIIKNDAKILDILDKAHIQPNDIANLITKRSDNQLLSRIISGEFDADRADYLLRDSHLCGIQYGIYDFKRYISSFVIDGDDLLVDEDNIQSIESLITARYYYNKQVVYHRTRQAYDIALENYIKEKNDKFPIFDLSKPDELDLEQFTWFDDYTIFQEAKNDVAAKKTVWAEYVLRLNHLKCFEQLQITKVNKLYAERLEKRLKKLKLQYFPKTASLKHDKLSSHSNEMKDNYFVTSRYGRKKENLFNCSAILKGLSQNPDIFKRYFCTKKDSDNCTKARETASKKKGT